MVSDPTTVKTRATASESTTTWNIRSRTWYSRCRIRNVDCETSTTRPTRPSTRDRPRAVERHRPLAAGRQPRRRAVAAGERAIDLGGLDAPGADEDRLRGRRPRLARRSASASAARTTRRRGTVHRPRSSRISGALVAPVSSRPSRPATRCESATTRPSGAMIRSRTSDDCSRRSSSRCGPSPSPIAAGRGTRRAPRRGAAPAAPSPAPAARAGAARRRRDTRGRRPGGRRAAR